MHSNIYQIGSKPISKDDYSDPSDYYDNSDFADYVGDELKGKDRDDAIGYLSEILSDVFTPCGRDTFAYKGKEAMRAFKQKWAEHIKELANELTADNLFQNLRLFNIRMVTEKSHIRTGYRFDIVGWAGGVAEPFGELIEYAASQLKEGDRIYVGAVIDYHY